jgi:pseudouridine synthase
MHHAALKGAKVFIMAEKVRLQRFMADSGVASRRECEAMIAGGRVSVNGKVRSQLPVMIDPKKDKVTVDEEIVEFLKPQKLVYFLLNKPKGVLVTNYDPDDRRTAVELMRGVEERVFPVGRLDMDSRGALIMTNDGELANRLTHPRYGVEKTYIVEVDGKIGPGEIERVKRGMWLGPERGTREAVRTDRFAVKIVGRERGRTVMEVTIAEGKNREIRRVMARIGHVVRDLNRVAIGTKVTIKGVDPGKYRALTESEVAWLMKVSSAEYHERERNATQRWFEQKEADKERKRLAKEASQAIAQEKKQKPASQGIGRPITRPARAPIDSSARRDDRSAERTERAPFRPATERTGRPFERKGRKPFVPPTGRNAGKILGGDARNRKALERDRGDAPPTSGSHPMGNVQDDV